MVSTDSDLSVVGAYEAHSLVVACEDLSVEGASEAHSLVVACEDQFYSTSHSELPQLFQEPNNYLIRTCIGCTLLSLLF